ncbi:MAG: tRNA (N(6)-L-threonylcarbamoyladenosine(37)-C(2))-methylthiotransferase [archaeon]
MANVHIITFGCSLNQSDSEAMAGILHEHALHIVDDPAEADVVIINSCTVKSKAERKLFTEIERFSKMGKKIVIAGCVPQADRHLSQTVLKDYSIIGTTQLDRIADVVEETLAGNAVHILDRKANDRLKLPVIRRNKNIGIIPINDGCLGSCTYCKTVQARGTLRSYTAAAIKKAMQAAVDDGCTEIWLTSQDTACYGLDLFPQENLPSLLRQLLTVRGDFKIRMGMGNPTHLKAYVDELAELLKHPKLFKFVHIPLQSGSDRVLSMMHREYTVADFEKIVHALRTADPRVAIATDMIVGFPTEIDADFEESLCLLQRTQPDVVNVSRFWARPGTAAARMPPVAGKTSTMQARAMMALAKQVMLERNQQWLGWEGACVIEELNERRAVLRNDYYKHILLPTSHVLASAVFPGKRLSVRIMQVSAFDLHSISDRVRS